MREVKAGDMAQATVLFTLKFYPMRDIKLAEAMSARGFTPVALTGALVFVGMKTAGVTRRGDVKVTYDGFGGGFLDPCEVVPRDKVSELNVLLERRECEEGASEPEVLPHEGRSSFW